MYDAATVHRCEAAREPIAQAQYLIWFKPTASQHLLQCFAFNELSHQEADFPFIPQQSFIIDDSVMTDGAELAYFGDQEIKKVRLGRECRGNEPNDMCGAELDMACPIDAAGTVLF